MKALIAMSGGVDSSVAAYLMKEDGYDCIGVTMKLFQNDDIGIGRMKTCCSLEDVEDARSVAFRLGIRYVVLNFKKDFKEKVIGRFIASYEKGATPNPCIDCNRYMKFDRLYQKAKEFSCDYVVTGHYAKIEETDGRFLLKKALDESKDQSYVLYSMTQEQLAHTIFPLGVLTKHKTREIANEQGFYNADKPDSQDICFVPDGDYVKFMENYTGKHYPPGDLLDLNGNIVGQHKGAVHYTIGQRKGLGLSMDRPVYVCSKDMDKNTVTIAAEEELYKKELLAGQVNWIAVQSISDPMHVSVKIRYRQKEQPAVIYPEPDGRIRVVFEKPQRAVTPGQAAVFYDGDIVVGGGTIL